MTSASRQQVKNVQTTKTWRCFMVVSFTGTWVARTLYSRQEKKLIGVKKSTSLACHTLSFFIFLHNLQSS